MGVFLFLINPERVIDIPYYTAEKLLKLDKVHLRNLHSDHLTDFYEKYLEPCVFQYKLDDKTVINLNFNKDQFFHLSGFHHLFPGQKGITAWNNLKKKPKQMDKLNFKNNEFILNRLRYFHLLPKILKEGQLIKLNKKDFPDLRYKSDYFLVLKHDGRCLKLGIGIDNERHYPETFLVDMDEPRYNLYVDPKYKVNIDSFKITSRYDLKKEQLRKEIIAKYITKYPAIKHVSHRTIEYINKLNIKRNRVCSIKEVKATYKQAGKALDKYPSEKNKKSFNYVEGIYKDLKKAEYKENAIKTSINKKPISEIEL